MAVAAHLGIRLDEYDARIRTFIPHYDEMLAAAVQALCTLPTATPHIVDLGTGTGALAAACVHAMPAACVTIIDEDPDILAVARARLQRSGTQVSGVTGSFLEVPLPACDAVVGSLTFHHVRTTEEKAVLYRRCREALAAHGMFVSADCCPSANPDEATREMAAWRAHLRETYSEQETEAYFAAWAQEDVYCPLPTELELLARVGLAPRTVWRRGAFAAIAAVPI